MCKALSGDLHKLGYQLRRLVADKDSHQVLKPKQTEIIDVIPNTYMFFKIITKDMLTPGKVHFGFADGQYVRARRHSGKRSNITSSAETPTSPTRVRFTRTKVELSAYFSVHEKNREPTQGNCDKEIDSPSGAIAMPFVGKDRFENDDVYLSIFSITGCQVHLTVLFPDLKIANLGRKDKSDAYVDEAQFDNYLVCKKYKAENRNKGAN